MLNFNYKSKKGIDKNKKKLDTKNKVKIQKCKFLGGLKWQEL